MMRTALALAAVAAVSMVALAAQDARAQIASGMPATFAASASSCSGWKTICETRGPGCGAKMTACLKSGCWTEGQAHGGKKHCGLKKE